MKRALIAGISLIALATLLIAGGRRNVVWHWDDGDQTAYPLSASRGSCRHHLTAHPLDSVNGVHDADACQ
jgi:hypothetical protein